MLDRKNRGNRYVPLHALVDCPAFLFEILLPITRNPDNEIALIAGTDVINLIRFPCNNTPFRDDRAGGEVLQCFKDELLRCSELRMNVTEMLPVFASQRKLVSAMRFRHVDHNWSTARAARCRL